MTTTPTSTRLEPSQADPSRSSLPASKSESSDCSIRLATAEDAPAVSKLISETWSTLFGYSVSKQDLDTYLSTSLSPETIRSEIQESNNVFILAVTNSHSTSTPTPSGGRIKGEGNEDILGVSQLVVNSKSTPSSSTLDPETSIELQRIYISLKTHGKGLGSSLIRASEEKGRELGRKQIWLGVWENNEKALKFYEKCEFKCVDEKVFYAGSSRRRDLVMVKDL
ncbi:uncharacterized protein I303_100568 [Kwoniella dejecticola CBS 10117]|uniref:N-acetyltransferase domain-containing protein n=1 Tax=Kwoniella dejecticola CBS 10117 TaxID=1296121 RepID=A0A1A6AFA0_9TREE|nr:uncharacterized protein I303_00569 [Kwoniella dejecticola CBS 10117]OBR88752.1 hypothetical protein I303_00569 [Kwoniella dejecticola CBS 10117]